MVGRLTAGLLTLNQEGFGSNPNSPAMAPIGYCAISGHALRRPVPFMSGQLSNIRGSVRHTECWMACWYPRGKPGPHAEVAQSGTARLLAKQKVAGSNPVFCSEGPLAKMGYALALEASARKGL
jgi:hypothetical protein